MNCTWCGESHYVGTERCPCGPHSDSVENLFDRWSATGVSPDDRGRPLDEPEKRLVTPKSDAEILALFAEGLASGPGEAVYRAQMEGRISKLEEKQMPAREPGDKRSQVERNRDWRNKNREEYNRSQRELMRRRRAK